MKKRVIQANSGYIEQIDTRNGKERKFKINVNDICLTDDVFVTNVENNSIVRLFPSGSVSTVFSTAPLEPLGICQSSEGGLLVTMVDTQSEQYQPDSSGRRPVRHVTLAGDVIREYEYQRTVRPDYLLYHTESDRRVTLIYV